MKENIDLTITLTDDEARRLRRVLRVGNDDEALRQKLAGIAKAAIAEYKTMLLGNRMQSRADEIQLLRLLLLVENLYGGHLPTESEVSQMFQVSERRARHLLSTLRSRFYYELDRKFADSIRQILSGALDAEHGKRRVVITSGMVYEEICRMVRSSAKPLASVRRVDGTANLYEIPSDTYDFLLEELDMRTS